MTETKTSFQEMVQKLFGGKHRHRWIVVLGIVGILLIALSSFTSGRSKESEIDRTNTDTQAYTAALEERLARMVSSIEGAGEAQVMVTLHNGVEYIYASEEKSNSDHSENGSQVSVRDDNHKTVVTVDAESGKEGLLVTEVQPSVRGVVVACEGAHDAYVASLVNQAVRTALDITEKRVCVIPYTAKKE